MLKKLSRDCRRRKSSDSVSGRATLIALHDPIASHHLSASHDRVELSSDERGNAVSTARQDHGIRAEWNQTSGAKRRATPIRHWGGPRMVDWRAEVMTEVYGSWKKDLLKPRIWNYITDREETNRLCVCVILNFFGFLFFLYEKGTQLKKPNRFQGIIARAFSTNNVTGFYYLSNIMFFVCYLFSEFVFFFPYCHEAV